MGNYQLANQLTFYTSYPLYAYASGLLEFAESDTDLTQEQLFNLINLNPSKISTFNTDALDIISFYINHKIKPDFFMTLGHNFAQQQNITLLDDEGEISTTGVINGNTDVDCDYNGWSLVDLSNVDNKSMIMQFINSAENMI